MVMAQPLFQLLKSKHPQAAIDCLAPPWSQPLLERMPQIRTAIPLPLQHGELGLGIRRQLGHALKGRYQHAIILPNSLKSALIPFFARIPGAPAISAKSVWVFSMICA
ncbi:MAG: waaF, partial [Magnetococcales bacterium]|nr:waaF [Magnetococcales bacterium]